MAKGFVCTSTEPIVETKAGKLRGFRLNDIYHFFGVDYGKAKRFEQPEPVDAWEGVKDALAYGYISYPYHPDSPNGDLMVPHRFWPKSEDCLNLNIWTPSLDKNAKKAVMVWLHGGGMADGSAVEMLAYDGYNISEYGDVVFVSVNHRLNVFGFLNVAKYGEKYKNSQNCGAADMALALQWVHDNIANFGGDPDCVTVIGQSGGGKKVGAMMQVPAAHGLVHRAIIMSGTSGTPTGDFSYPDSTDIADQMVAKAGGFEKLLELEPLALQDLARQVTGNGRVSWGPVENEWFGKTIRNGATENSKKIPLMVGTCVAEMSSFRFSVPGRQEMSEADKEALVYKQFGEENGKKLLEMFRKAYPDHDAVDAIVLDDNMRTTTLALLDQRAADGSAPSYSYMFAYDFPVDDGKAAWHCSDIPFVFRNIDRVAVCNEAEVGERLQKQMSEAWISFAKTGKPSSEDLPEWQPYTKGNEVTMIFDRTCRTAVNYDRDLVAYHKELEFVAENPNMLM